MSTALKSLSLPQMRRLFRVLDVAVKELGPNLPPRQLMALLAIAIANRTDEKIGVSDVDHRLGDLHSGSSSKLLRSMMHVETERKPGVANTVRSERDPHDLRKYNLELTPKGVEAVARIIAALG